MYAFFHVEEPAEQPPVEQRVPPTVVRLKRRRDGIIQGCDVYIGRKITLGGWDLPHIKWANPWSVKECGTVKKAVSRYRNYLEKQSNLIKSLGELEGKVLGFWYAI